MIPLTTLLIVWAMFAQVILVVFVLFKMGAARLRAVKENAVTKESALHSNLWPDYALKPANNYSNQFELPVLFFVGVLLTLHFGLNDWVVVILSWLFVVSRWVHMFIHTGSNHVPHRLMAFQVGLFMLVILWVYVVIRLTVQL